MTHGLNVITLMFSTVLLAACGGSGGDSGSATGSGSGATARAELEQKYSQYASSRFVGDDSRTTIESEPEAIQVFASMLLGNARVRAPQPPDVLFSLMDSYSADELPAKVDNKYQCKSGGSASISGTLTTRRQGNFSVTYQNCTTDGIVISGLLVAGINSSDLSSYSLYYDNLTLRDVSGPEGVSFSGFMAFDAIQPSDRAPFVRWRSDILATSLSTGEQRFDQTTRDYDSVSISFDGILTHSEFGRIDVTTDTNVLTSTAYYSRGKLSFLGARYQTAIVEFVDTTFVQFLIDTSGNGAPDIGHYFTSADQFFSADFRALELLPINQLGFAPTVSEPKLLTTSPDTSKKLIIEPGYYSDRDTDQENLSVSYEWSINGELIPSTTGDTMPAGVALKDDLVSVRMIVSDGQFSGTSEPLEFVIRDAPGSSEISGLPDSINAGESLTFTALFNDPDLASAQSAEIVYGPDGMTVNDGTVNWTVSTPLFDQTSVSFGLSFDGDPDDTLHEFSIRVRTPDSPMPVVRSGIDLPDVNDAIHIADFLGDAANEILTMSAGKVFALQGSGEDYSQVWMYPYRLPTEGKLRAIQTANLDSDTRQELVVATQHGISVIYNDSEMAYPLWTTEHFIQTIKVADLTADGLPEIIIVTNDSSYYSANKKLTVLEVTDTVDTVFELPLDQGASQIAVGNLDGDDQQEFVLNNGYVFDGLTFNNQWYRGQGFGNQHVAVGDLNGNGLDEIVAADEYGSITVFELASKAQLYSQENSNTCTVKISNIDSDNNLEVLIGDCQWGNITAYDWQTDTLTKAWEIGSQDHGVKSIAIGDASNNGTNEMLWGTGLSHSGANSLIVAKLTGTTPEIVLSETSTVQLDRFSAAGWGEITPGVERAIFIVPETEYGYSGQRLAYLDRSGAMTLSEEISNNWNGGEYGKVVDFDLDGFADIFLSSATYRDGFFQALKLETLFSHWSTEDGNGGSVQMIDAAKINDDPYPDALYTDGTILNLVDIKNEAIISSITGQSNITDFDYIAASNGDEFVAFAQGYNGIEVWRKQSDRFTYLSESDTECERLQFANADSDAQPELICSDSGYYYGPSEIVVFELDESLTQLNRFEVDGNITDFIVDPRKSQNQAIITGVTTNSDFGQESSELRSIYPGQSRTSWVSPKLVGEVTHRSIHFRPEIGENKDRLMFATDRAMFLVR